MNEGPTLKGTQPICVRLEMRHDMRARSYGATEDAPTAGAARRVPSRLAPALLLAAAVLLAAARARGARRPAPMTRPTRARRDASVRDTWQAEVASKYGAEVFEEAFCRRPADVTKWYAEA